MVTALRPDGASLSGEAKAARSRSRVYSLLSLALAFPEPEAHQEALTGRLRRRIAQALDDLPYRVAAGRARDWQPVADYDSFQSEYIRLFEVGPRGHPTCSLLGGHYSRDRPHTMEELVRFYNYFDLRVAPGLVPDHATVQLEFTGHLAEEEASAVASAGDAESFRRAQRDFLGRHLLAWWPAATAAVQRHRSQRFYGALIELTGRFLAAEQCHIASVLSGR